MFPAGIRTGGADPMTGQLDTVEVVTGQAPDFSVIWLHGLGADGHDFEPIVPALTLSVPMRFVFPHAPERAVTINQGMRMRAWYDILSLDRFSVEDEAGIRASEALLTGLIEAALRDSHRAVRSRCTRGCVTRKRWAASWFYRPICRCGTA
jgi:phospholipase/carboxylesterase